MWNYRLVRLQGGYIALHEVYYAMGGVPYTRTEYPVGVFGEDLNDAIECYSAMAEAFNQPVLDDSLFSVDKSDAALDLVRDRGFLDGG
ncbi:MAG: hypothetical protein LC687_05875 [Actinobacteria bacterium]|nr:hypothetical protein [Actinomycetota bacterium]